MYRIICLVTVKLKQFENFAVSCSNSTNSSAVVIILQALYQSQSNIHGCAKDVTRVVRNICLEKSNCSFSVTNDVLNHNSCGIHEKELEVMYTCSAVNQSK
jgi:hypothetical protein